MKKCFLAETSGWIGMVFILSAYFLVSYNVVVSESFSYQIINLIGAIALLYNSYYKKSKPLIALQISWAAIAIIAIIKLYI